MQAFFPVDAKSCDCSGDVDSPSFLTDTSEHFRSLPGFSDVRRDKVIPDPEEAIAGTDVLSQLMERLEQLQMSYTLFNRRSGG